MTSAPSRALNRSTRIGLERRSSLFHASVRARTYSVPSLDQTGVVARPSAGPATMVHANATFAAVVG